MKHVVLLFAVLTVVAVAAFGQALPTAPPTDQKENVYMGRLPKVDKSKLRDLKGVVRDEAENPIEGAQVSLKDPKTGKVQTYTTKKDGGYLFYDLDIDQTYELRAHYSGAEGEVTHKLTKYDTRKKPVLNFEMKLKKPA